ncbi:flocculation suppression protein [Gaeumannomyces tritici R3-111a-1]|uniref:Flocculation suppression protein n=1 Tax=Gaeumannomyces tritici (strain R3-111a-1) TaxID=644352 RepID=J3PB46_GAET3|nr:flocculation suppression protein [Gaeumannomyces tritici R3-111a-1]EJT71462.1 flocculation suppression protein [Gaeumannomyces tritici R3-111a-1]
MATAIETAHRSHHIDMRDSDPIVSRTVPILTPTIQMSAPSPGEPMEITTPTSSAPPSATKSPDSDANGHGPGSGSEHRSSTPKMEQHSMPGVMPAPAAAAPAVHQPKIVQTAFIHKLYNMLEDPNIQHLISWSPSQESFLMSPSNDFSKVLAQYFKHTNISSFVRQLNMYGFHKVSDVFHNGSDSTLWEFKHGNGNFKRGDLVGLREIKRRASRHALVHKEYNQQRPTPPQPGTPAEPMPIPEGHPDPRVANMESAFYEMSLRLQRSEESSHYMHIKQQAVMDTLGRLLYLNQELARTVLTLVPNPENPTHRDVIALQGNLQRQADMIRTLDEPHDQPFPSSRQFFTHLENAPVSPRQLPQDDPRRQTLAVPQPRQQNYYRPPVPSNLSISTRRPYGSIGSGTTPTQPSPSSTRPQPPPPPPVAPHPLANVELPPSSLARRHTSADIRAHGWPPAPGAGASPFASGPPSTQWPSSPNRAHGPEDQRIRDSLSSYSLLPVNSQHQQPPPPHRDQHHPQHRPPSRPESPPPPFSNGGSGLDTLTNWSWGSAGRNSSLAVKGDSLPPTRRGSMAHILNPTDTAEVANEDGDDPRGDDDRKRKRLV